MSDRTLPFRYIPTLGVALFALPLYAGTVVIPPDVTVDPLVGGFSAPLAARHAGDGSGRLFIVEQNGVIKIFDGSQVLATPFLDLSGITTAAGEGGLLGLDFHPDFASNGKFYVDFTADGLAGVPVGDTVIAEYQVSAGNPNVADPTSRRILLTIRQDFTNHNGGNVLFGPDGYLYIGMGDGGGGNDTCNRAQTLDPANLTPNCGVAGGSPPQSLALLGKMLRLDVDNTTPPGANQLCGANPDGSAQYAIPADNPFIGADLNNACDEVWAFGLRNPFRFSFDRSAGDLWIGDVGQNAWEEIDFEPLVTFGGINYGWNPCEGTHPRGNPNPASVCTFSSEFPVMEYDHQFGRCSITGGYRYRGSVASLWGDYLFGDFCSGEIFLAQETSPGTWEFVVLDDIGVNLNSFGETEQGDLIAVRQDGQLFIFNGDTEVILADSFE